MSISVKHSFVSTIPDDSAAFSAGEVTPSRWNAEHIVTGIASPIINVKDYGAIADGSSHLLSTRYSTLAAAQAVYPFITSLSQEIDYAAIKQASNVAFGADGFEHATDTHLNIPLYVPAGKYVLGDDTWLIRNAVSISITGAGQISTIITSNQTALAFDGLWYSTISNIEFETTNNPSVAAAVVDMDGNVPGQPYPTRGVQGNTLTNLFIHSVGNCTDYCFALTRLGGSGGQGSENSYINMHTLGSGVAAYYQNGYNALDNIFIGGDLQGYLTSGIVILAGSIGIYKTSFECNHGYTQILNDGWDIDCSAGGVFDGIPIYGCRSESLRFCRGGGSQNPDIRAFSHNPAGFNSWASLTPWSQYNMIHKTGVDGMPHMYLVTTAGTSGVSEPTWPATGTVSDGSVVWTQSDYNVVKLLAGNFDWSTCYIAVDHGASVNFVGGTWAYGNNKLGNSINWGFNVTGSNAATEGYISTQNSVLSNYTNPQGSPVTLNSGITYPASSTGVISNGNLVLGASSVNKLDYGVTTSNVWTSPSSFKSKTVRTQGFIVSTLPTGVVGDRAYVTDSTQTLTVGIGAVVAGTGVNTVPVFYDGTNWRTG